MNLIRTKFPALCFTLESDVLATIRKETDPLIITILQYKYGRHKHFNLFVVPKFPNDWDWKDLGLWDFEWDNWGLVSLSENYVSEWILGEQTLVPCFALTFWTCWWIILTCWCWFPVLSLALTKNFISLLSFERPWIDRQSKWSSFFFHSPLHNMLMRV